MTIQLATTLRNNMLDEITGYAGGSALLRIYSGTIPSSVGDAITGTLLAELTCNATFAPSATGGVLTLNSISNDTSANATGTASHFRLWKSDGTTAVLQGTVSTSGADLNLNTTSIVSGGIVAVTSATLTAPGA